MPSLNKTKFLNLNFWDKDDIPKMDDFNIDNQKIDDAVEDLNTLIASIKVALDSDDATLDTMQEVVEYIKANKDALEFIGGSKVSIADVVNNLTTASVGKVLDARQGKVLKDLINAAQAILDDATADAVAGKIIMRDASGRAQVETPKSDTDIANKKYVDNIAKEISEHGVLFATEAEAVAGESTDKAMSPATTKAEIKAFGTKASNAVNATLTVAAWSGTAAPYTQTLTISGVTATSNGYLGLAQSATDEQDEAARSAMLRIAGQGTNTVTITAKGDKPTVVIPVTVTIVG